MDNEVLQDITFFYLESTDFNGIPYRALQQKFGESRAKKAVVDLTLNMYVSANFGDAHPNPHIRAFWDHLSPEEQAGKISDGAEDFCVYPNPVQLKQVVNDSEYQDRPYTRAMALGEPQLSHRAFELSVLETYRKDPRYLYQADDIQGFISIEDDHNEESLMKDSDKILLEHFGFAYSKNMDRYVAGFVRDLHNLSPEHQAIWRAKEVDKNTQLHPEYLRSVLGDFPSRIPICEAFIWELQTINRMCRAIGYPPLFKDDFINGRPKEFAFLLRPTRSELNAFIMLLDKMISDNLNKKFFERELDTVEEITRKDWKIEVRPKGTIRLLEEWVNQKFRPRDSKPLKAMFQTFRDIRKRRQEPAHAVSDDKFDQEYFREQREILISAYDAVRTLRLILANHPHARGVHVNEDLYRGNVCTF